MTKAVNPSVLEADVPSRCWERILQVPDDFPHENRTYRIGLQATPARAMKHQSVRLPLHTAEHFGEVRVDGQHAIAPPLGAPHRSERPAAPAGTIVRQPD